MPNYEYECPRCGVREERNQPVANRDQARCYAHPDEVIWMRRLPAAPGFKLVGAGFHANDYKPKKKGTDLYAEKP